MCLLEETTLALQKGAIGRKPSRQHASYDWRNPFGPRLNSVEDLHRSISVILDSFDLNLSATHIEGVAMACLRCSGVGWIDVAGESSLFLRDYGLVALAV